MNRRHYTKLNWFPKRKKQLLLETPWKRQQLKSRRSSCLRKLSLTTGRKHCSVCSKETKPFKPLRISSRVNKTTFFRSSLKFLVFEMRPRKSKKSLRTSLPSSKRWRLMRSIFKRDSKISRMRERDSTSNSLCSSTQSSRLRVNLRKWMTRRQESRRNRTFSRNLLCPCIQKPSKSEMTSSTMPLSKKQSRRVQLTCWNRQSWHIKISLRKKLILKIYQMKSQELELITSTVSSRMICSKRNLKIW